MKILVSNELIKNSIILLLVVVLGLFYWQTIMTLPLFGDATIHAGNAKDLVEKGWSSLNADYPAFYSVLMAIFYIFFGESGFNAVVYIGFLFLILSTFLFIRVITKNYYVALVSMIMVSASPKIIFYSARMYQEILISALFIFCFYLFFKYIEIKRFIYLALLILFLGVTVATKQQGLIILYGTIVTVSVFFLFIKHLSFYHLLGIIFIPLLIALPFIGVLYHTKGFLLPGGNEFGPIKKMDSVGQTLFHFNPERQLTTQFDPAFQSQLDLIQQQYYYSINAWGESKHIWPNDVFTDFEKFNQANSLYVDFQGVDLESESLYYLSFIGLLFGLFIAIKHAPTYRTLLVTTPVFLLTNYVLFFRNADQQRYHIFLPIFLLGYIFIFFKHAFLKLKLKHRSSILLCFSVVIIIVAILSPRLLMNRNWGQSQIYTSSMGGINSIKETGNWFKQKTDAQTILGQQCGNEISYYSRRKTIGDWRIYLMNNDEIKTFFKESNISYYVLFKSQIVADDKWRSFCWVPKNFADFLDFNYQKSFISSKGDIIVYEIK